MTTDPDRRYWERHAKNYDRSMLLLGKPMRRVVELVGESVAGRKNVLELAAGTGMVTFAVAPKVARLVATDYAEAMVAMLKERGAAAGVANVEFRQADLYKLDFPPGSFDAVVAANVLHLVPDLSGAIRSLKAMLAPGGKLVCPTYLHDQTAASWLLSRALALTGFPGHRRFDAASLRQALEREGMRVTRTETAPGVIPIGFVEGTFA